MADDFTERYRDLLTGWYDCVDRIVLNAYRSRHTDLFRRAPFRVLGIKDAHGRSLVKEAGRAGRVAD